MFIYIGYWTLNIYYYYYIVIIVGVLVSSVRLTATSFAFLIFSYVISRGALDDAPRSTVPGGKQCSIVIIHTLCRHFHSNKFETLSEYSYSHNVNRYV